MRQIEEQYIQTGQVRFGYLHFIIRGQESQWAAEASECAAEQGEEMFWTYHDKLFAIATSDSPIPFRKDNLKKFASELGLKTQKFNECLDSGRYTSIVEIDTQTGVFLRFQGTPSFLINSQPLVGAQPFDVFQRYIEAELRN